MHKGKLELDALPRAAYSAGMKTILLFLVAGLLAANISLAHPKGGTAHPHPKAAPSMSKAEAKQKRHDWCKKHPKKCAERKAHRKKWCKSHPAMCEQQQGNDNTNSLELSIDAPSL